MRNYKPRPPHGDTRCAFYAKDSNRLLAYYAHAQDEAHARDCFRKAAYMEPKRRAKFDELQTKARQRISNVLAVCQAHVEGQKPTAQQREALLLLARMAGERIPWDNTLIDAYSARKRTY